MPELSNRFEAFVKKLSSFSSADLSVGAGKVLQAVYHRGYYRVAGPGGHGDYYDLIEFGALRADGQTSKESIPVGSFVVYVYDKTFKVGYIVGAFTQLRSGSPSEGRPAIKYRVTDNPVTHEPEKTDGVHTVMAGDHVPADLPAAAFARTNPYGGAIVLDKHFAMLQAKDGSGLVALDDGSVQISSETLFIRSFLREYQEYKNKDGLDSVDEHFLSVATGLGYLNKAALAEATSKENDNSLDATVIEPDRSSLPQSTVYSGETLEGFSKVLRTYTEEDRAKSVPLFRETLFRDGSYVLQSASQIFIEKFCLIEDPFKRKDTPLEDPELDKPLDFEHATKAKISGIAALGTEYLAYLLGTRFPYKTKLYWDVNDTKQVAQTLGIGSAVLRKADPRTLPQRATVLVDFEKNLQRTIYGSRSGIYFHDDGAVVIKDGYGSSITMGRGNIVISPAKDLMLQVGQDIAGIVGGEVNVSSIKGMSLSAEDGGVSISGSRFINIRSTRQDGGVLIESLASKQNKDDKGKPVGVVIKADDGCVSVAAQKFETNTQDTLIKSKDYTIAAGSLSIFAETRMNFVATAYTNKVSTSTPGIFIYSGGGATAFMNFNGYSTFDGGLMFIKDYVLIDNSLLVNGVVNGLYSAAFVGQPGDISEKTAKSYRKTVTDLTKALNKTSNSTAELVEKGRKLDETRAGLLYLNDDNVEALHFSVASSRKIPYEFAQTEWQADSETTLTLDTDNLGGSPMLLTEAIFYTFTPIRSEDNGAYKDNTEQVKETELLKDKVVDKFTTNVSSNEYKADPYDKV